MAGKRKANHHLPKYVSVIGASYWYRPTHGEHVRICKVGEEPALYKWLGDKLEPVSNADLTTMSKLFDRYRREVLPALRPRTQKQYLGALAKLDEVFGAKHPDDVEPRDVGRFLDVPKGKIHRNRMVAVLSAVYTKAVGRWYVAKRNPCRDVERNESRKRNRYVTDVEFLTVYKAMPPRIQIAMDLALITGQRQGDLLALKWEQVSADGILFQQGKTGKRLLVGMSPALQAVLDRAKALVPQLPREYVLRTRKGQAYTSEGFRAPWQRRMRKLIKTGVLAQRFTFHDIRAKCVSDSVDLQAAFDRAGHTSMAMTRGVYDRGVRKVTPLK